MKTDRVCRICFTSKYAKDENLLHRPWTIYHTKYDGRKKFCDLRFAVHWSLNLILLSNKDDVIMKYEWYFHWVLSKSSRKHNKWYILSVDFWN